MLKLATHNIALKNKIQAAMLTRTTASSAAMPTAASLSGTPGNMAMQARRDTAPLATRTGRGRGRPESPLDSSLLGLLAEPSRSSKRESWRSESPRIPGQTRAEAGKRRTGRRGEREGQAGPCPALCWPRRASPWPHAAPFEGGRHVSFNGRASTLMEESALLASFFLLALLQGHIFSLERKEDSRFTTGKYQKIGYPEPVKYMLSM